MVRLMRHRQTKGPDSARPHLNRRATPRLHPSEICRGSWCYGDLDEVAGATDAIACSSRSYFLRSNSWLLGDNSARCAAHELLVNPGSATPEAIKRRNGH